MGRVRSSVPRHRLPLHRRALADPVVLRRWLLVAVLAASAGGLTGRVVADADAARRRWGETRTVLVADRPVEAGDPLDAAMVEARWPVALVPDDALGRLPEGARAAAPLATGSPVTDVAVAGGADGGGDGRQLLALPPGLTPLPLAVGDRLDVWATVDASLADGTLSTRQVVTGATVVSADDAAVVVAVEPDSVAELTEAVALATLTLVATP
ncbi:hypothetical protein BH23ACT2_BH23ACT2_25630 [soil metagenome]